MLHRQFGEDRNRHRTALAVRLGRKTDMAYRTIEIQAAHGVRRPVAEPARGAQRLQRRHDRRDDRRIRRARTVRSAVRGGRGSRPGNSVSARRPILTG